MSMFYAQLNQHLPIQSQSRVVQSKLIRTMPIRPLEMSSGYQSIPGHEEDVTPVDRYIDKRAQKAFKYVVIAALVIVVGVVAVVVWFKYKANTTVSTYQTAAHDGIGLKLLSVQEVNSLHQDKLKAVAFGNTNCEHDAVAGVFTCTNMATTPAVISLEPSKAYQEIVGFGGAFTESTAINFYKLPQPLQDKIIEDYFGKDGIGFTLGRIHINSCDFSLQSYSFDNIAGDYDLAYFDTEVTHDNAYILPLIRLAMAASPVPIKLLASPWSPPAWMKAPDKYGNQSMLGSAVPNGLLDDPQVKLAWARYISKFIVAYENKGVPIWSVTPQNEPEFAAPWEACAFTAEYERDFIVNYLGPVLRAEHPELLLLGFDHNKDHLLTWTHELMKGDAEKKYVDGMAFHWYSGGARVEDGTYGYDAINASHHFAPEGVLLASEGCNCPGVELGNWLRAERLGHDVMFDLQNHAQGWIDWNLLVDSQGGPNHLGNFCDAALVTNPNFTDIHVQPKFHYMAHFSKFIPPGAVRIASRAVGNFNYETVDPNIQAGVELGMFACERSVRQLWTFVAPKKVKQGNTLKLTTEALTMDVTYAGKVRLCVAQSARLPDRSALRIADCSDTGAILLSLRWSELGQLVDTKTSQCVSFVGDVREPGALLELAKCENVPISESTREFMAVDHQFFAMNPSTGEITAPRVYPHMCLTAGWPFLTAVAFQHAATSTIRLGANIKTSVVVMNEAAVATSLVVWNTERDEYLGLAIDSRAIQTILF